VSGCLADHLMAFDRVLRTSPLWSTMVHYGPLRSTTVHYGPRHFSPLQPTTVHSTPLHYPTNSAIPEPPSSTSPSTSHSHPSSIIHHPSSTDVRVIIIIIRVLVDSILLYYSVPSEYATRQFLHLLRPNICQLTSLHLYCTIRSSPEGNHNSHSPSALAAPISIIGRVYYDVVFFLTLDAIPNITLPYVFR
jgi:hypothetical protein